MHRDVSRIFLPHQRAPRDGEARTGGGRTPGVKVQEGARTAAGGIAQLRTFSRSFFYDSAGWVSTPFR